MQYLFGAERWFSTNLRPNCIISKGCCLWHKLFSEAHICRGFHLETLWIDRELHLWTTNQHGMWTRSEKLLRKDEILRCLGYTVVSGTYSYYLVYTTASSSLVVLWLAVAKRLRFCCFIVFLAPFKELLKQLPLWAYHFFILRNIISFFSSIILLLIGLITIIADHTVDVVYADCRNSFQFWSFLASYRFCLFVVLLLRRRNW